MSFAHSPRIITDGLVLCLDAANISSYVSGSTSWYDLTTNGNTGTLTNGPTFNTGSGGSIVFDGVDDYVQMSSNLSSIIVTDTPGYSIAGWFNASVNDNTWRTIITKESTLGTNRQYYIGLNGGYAGAAGSFSFFSNQNGYGGLSTTTAIQTNTWYYFAATHYGTNGNTANTLYVRSLSVLSIGSPFQPSNSAGIDTDAGTSPITMGKYTNSSPFLFNGNIANITYYNRALTAQEVLQNYNALRSRFNL